VRKKLILAAAFLLLGGCSALTPANLDGDATFRVYMPEAAIVQVIGDWNEWGGLTAAGGMIDPRAGAMIRGEDGFWTLSLDLPRGRYRYAFLVDGCRLAPDDLNPQTALFEGSVVSLFVKGE
jgi:1,4-alpha-glucan branching enzyme